MTFALVITLARFGVFAAISSNFSIKAYVIVIPGNLSFPLWVLGSEWPPNLEIKDKSKPKALINHSTAGPDSSQRTSHNG